MHGAPNRDPLAFATGKLAHFRLNGDSFAPEADRIEHDLASHRFLPFHIDEAKPIHNLASDKEIPPENLFFTERFILINGFDSVNVRTLDVITTKIDFAAGNV